MKLYFLDFEASSLDSDSYPIEVAWVDESGQGESYLIQPHWSWNGWSAASEGIHHISQDMLRNGTPATIVAHRAQAVLTGSIIITDEPSFDRYWLETLLKIIDVPPLVIEDIHALIGQEIKRVRSIVKTTDQQEWHRQTRILLDQAQTVAMTAFESTKRGLEHRHRALPDAQEHWQCWKAVHGAIDDLIREHAKD